MFTLFFAGDAFAPNLTLGGDGAGGGGGGERAQAWLQGHFTRAMARLAAALRAHDNVIGFGSMNEPLPGCVGVSSSSSSARAEGGRCGRRAPARRAR